LSCPAAASQQVAEARLFLFEALKFILLGANLPPEASKYCSSLPLNTFES
jgi:hypothetical protein